MSHDVNRAMVLYLHVHQPWRVRQYSVFDTAERHDYFSEHDDSDRNNERIFKKVAEKSYRPMNALLEKLLEQHPGFEFSVSITGTFIEQAQLWAPDVLESFKRMVATGRLEIVAETYHHSLAFFYNRQEFEAQVDLHAKLIKDTFGVTPTAFRNTELAYNDELATWADAKGYRAILAEGWDPVLNGRTPNQLYKPVGAQRLGLLLKNYRLSDDIAFRFGNRAWSEWPLKPETYEQWLEAASSEGPLLNLFMDYETFGEHQWEDTGIFNFFDQLIGRWLKSAHNQCHTVTDAALLYEQVDEISMPNTVTWADNERDLTAWLGNSMQQEAMRHVYALAEPILRTNDEALIADWRKLLTSDHPYYMCTKWFTDGDVHAYFSPYDSPYDAFLYFMNALRDVRFRLMEHKHGGFYG